MEQHSLHAVGGRGFPRDGRKSGKHVFKKRLFPKKGHQKNTRPKTTLFTPFLLLFMFRSIMVATWPHPRIATKSIKVTPRNWEGGRRRSEWCFFFSNLKLDFWKWTFIFVHFWFFISRFEKNVENLTQTIMLTIVFLSLKKRDDKFWTFCIRF